MTGAVRGWRGNWENQVNMRHSHCVAVTLEHWKDNHDQEEADADADVEGKCEKSSEKLEIQDFPELTGNKETLGADETEEIPLRDSQRSGK